MPGTLAARDITKAHGVVRVLEGVSVKVGARDRVGVIGPNGIGKTTLLLVLAGLEKPDGGSVERTPADLAVGYVPQEPDSRDGETLLAYVFRRTGVADAERALIAASAGLAGAQAAGEEYDRALESFLSLGGGDLERRARTIAAELGLATGLDRPLTTMSGGERARARLAATLLARVDVILLDEPTNDLDFDGLDRLEAFVTGFNGAVVIVSHDRAFLERTVDRVLELESETRKPREYAGGFAEFERLRALARERHEADFRRYADERGRFETLLRERRGQARSGGKQANRRATHALSTKVRSAEKRLEWLDPVEKPWRPWELRLELPRPERSGDLVARLEGAVVERDAFRLGPVDLELAWGERVTVVGRNGSGKSTLLRAILGSVALSAGRRRLGPGVIVGRLEQERSLFLSDDPLVDRFADAAGLAHGDARTLLGRFGIRGSSVERPARSLSPGERTRAGLALLQALGVNLLVLDEPTNHLDLEAIEELERALADYAGTIVLVTHDRRLLGAFGSTRTIALDGGRVSTDQ